MTRDVVVVPRDGERIEVERDGVTLSIKVGTCVDVAGDPRAVLGFPEGTRVTRDTAVVRRQDLVRYLPAEG